MVGATNFFHVVKRRKDMSMNSEAQGRVARARVYMSAKKRKGQYHPAALNSQSAAGRRMHLGKMRMGGFKPGMPSHISPAHKLGA